MIRRVWGGDYLVSDQALSLLDRIHKVLGVENSVKSRTSYGGTAPANVLAQAARWNEMLTGETSEPRKLRSGGHSHGDGGIE